ncbi:hypothetical protein ACOSP7_004652 [Xanthoceras sorbifolium]
MNCHKNPPEELQHMSEDQIYDYVTGEPSSGVVTRRCTQVQATTRKAEEAEVEFAQLFEELTIVKAEPIEMHSNFNEQLLEIQAQHRGNFEIFFFCKDK